MAEDVFTAERCISTSVPHFAYVHAVGYTRDDRLLPMHANFFAAHPVADAPIHIPIFGSGPHRPVSVIKNVFNLSPVFPFEAGLVVNSLLKSRLSQISCLEFREVKIELAFSVPYGLEDLTFEKAGIDLSGSATDVVRRFATAYACKVPEEKFYEIVSPLAKQLRPNSPDMQAVVVARDAPAHTSIYARTILVSRSAVEKFGMMFSWGHIFRPDVYELVDPYLREPWFWSQRYSYPPKSLLE